MSEQKASYIRNLIRENKVKNVLELGFFHGKSSAYIAAILQDQGAGHLTTIDLRSAAERNPSITDLLTQLGLSHRVDAIFAHRSYTWELGKMLQRNPRPQFDLCYIDGGHTWDVTGFGVILADMLMRPGGWIVLDDLEWTISNSASLRDRETAHSQEERDSKGVRMVWEIIVPQLGYTRRFEEERFQWGIAQKPVPSLSVA